ncbi:MAG: hypothetical protein K2Q18_15685, partial [Bdellovibrionales bacterium]|nr:hypothetical protein [Bdellovibrionales bacterium]
MKSLKQFLFSIIVCALSTSLVNAQGDSKTNIESFDELKEIIKGNKVLTINELLDFIPADMKSKIIYVYESHALNASLATPLTPRMIFSNTDSSLIFTLTKSLSSEETAAGKDILEAIAYDKKLKKFQTQIVTFDGKHDPTTLVETNAPVCLKCHGANPAPIFQDYNSWPGMYGSFSDGGITMKGTKEYQYLTSFLENKDLPNSDPRYKKVDTSKFVKTDYGYNYLPTEDTPAFLLGMNI